MNNEKVLNKNEKDNYNQKVTVEISGTHEKEGLGEFNTHRTYILSKKGKEKQQITCLTSLCKWMTEQRLGGMVMGEILLRDIKDEKMWQATT